MSTEKKENNSNINEELKDDTVVYSDSDTTDAADIVSAAKKARAERNEQEKRNSIEKAKQIEQEVKANKMKQMAELREQQKKDRKAAYAAARIERKKNATKCVFLTCISSSCFSYITIGVLTKIFLNLPEWLFLIIMAGLSLAIITIHTAAYKVIRDEIYRK